MLLGDESGCWVWFCFSSFFTSVPFLCCCCNVLLRLLDSVSVYVAVVRIDLRFGTYCGIGGGIRVGFVLFLARKRIVVAISWISFSEK